MRPAVFLDRDGTLIEERGYLDRLDMLTPFPWTADAVRLINRAGFAAVVITNQAAIGRGIIDEAFLSQVHGLLDERLALGDARIDRYYYCPHHPDAALDACFERLTELGLRPTGPLDRTYFRSVYFRMPDGLLHEVEPDPRHMNLGPSGIDL